MLGYKIRPHVKEKQIKIKQTHVNLNCLC